MLWFGGGFVVEALEGVFDVAGHGDVTGPVVIVPFEMHAKEGVAGVVGCHLVFGADAVFEVFGMLQTGVLDAKVVDDEAEHDWSGLVFEEAMGVGALMIAMLGEMWDQFVIGDASGMW